MFKQECNIFESNAIRAVTCLIANIGILVNGYQETKLYGPVGLVNVISKFYLTIMIIAALNTKCWTNVALGRDCSYETPYSSFAKFETLTSSLIYLESARKR